MAYDLFVTESAHEDLEEALGYIAGDLANPSAAANLLNQVEACYEQLKDFPTLYECCHDLRLRNLGVAIRKTTRINKHSSACHGHMWRLRHYVCTDSFIAPYNQICFLDIHIKHK